MVMELPLTGGAVTLVDDADFTFLSQWDWTLHKTPRGKLYARRSRLIAGKYKGLLLHRALMCAPENFQVDHINGNSLDNRKGNLRLCTASQNSANTPSRAGVFRGVEKRRKGWWAVARPCGGRDQRGPFATAEEAARAYDVMAFAYYENFAMLNFPAEVAQ